MYFYYKLRFVKIISRFSDLVWKLSCILLNLRQSPLSFDLTGFLKPTMKEVIHVFSLPPSPKSSVLKSAESREFYYRLNTTVQDWFDPLVSLEEKKERE